MASIRKRGKNYLVVVSMGYDSRGKRLASVQKTFATPEGLTPKQEDKWISEQAVLYENEVKNAKRPIKKDITLEKYAEHFIKDVMPSKLALSTQSRTLLDINHLLPYLGNMKLQELDKPTIRNAYMKMREIKSKNSGQPLKERTIAGIHACLCGMLSSAIEEGYLEQNPAWRCYKWGSKREDKVVADEEMAQKLIAAFEKESVLYETFFKLILATGMRRGECCALKWRDIHWDDGMISIRSNIVAVSGHKLIDKEPKTRSGIRDVYVSAKILCQLREYETWYKLNRGNFLEREILPSDYIFTRKSNEGLPMNPDTFTFRFNKILEKNGLPKELTVHSLRHTNASLQIASGVDVLTVAQSLGHSMPSTTMDLYGHAFSKQRRLAQEKVTDAIGL